MASQKPWECFISLLDVVGMELIFFKAAFMVLHFGFVMKTLLITRQCFSYC